jgi:8-oxo-dGTP pyrophosphatase MutT (NUDIX family)
MEELIPLSIDHVLIKTSNRVIERKNVRYCNIHVKDCPPFIFKEEDHYTRRDKIERLDFNLIATPGSCYYWPDHPRDNANELLGAIIILKSTDDKILLLKNRFLWGLPKGARNYVNFLKMKDELMLEYLNSGTLKTFIFAEFQEIETAEDNICRETLEETGIVIDKTNLQQWDDSDPSPYTKYIYELNFPASHYLTILKANGTDHENDEVKWINMKDLSTLLFKHKTNRLVKVFNHITYSYLHQYNEFKLKK